MNQFLSLNQQQPDLFSENNEVLDFLISIEKDLELSKESFCEVLKTLPTSLNSNQKIQRIKKRKKSFHHALRLW